MLQAHWGAERGQWPRYSSRSHGHGHQRNREEWRDAQSSIDGKRKVVEAPGVDNDAAAPELSSSGARIVRRSTSDPTMRCGSEDSRDSERVVRKSCDIATTLNGFDEVGDER